MTARRAPVARVTAIVLAAGSSSRYGGNKLTEPYHGRPLAQHAIDSANDAHVDEVVVVVGHDAETLLAALRPGRARIVRNPDHRQGQSTSLRAGIGAASGDGAIVLLADQPHVTARLLDALVARQRETGAAAVISASGGHRSPPVLLHRDLWPDIERLTGDVGARDVLAGRADVVELEVGSDLGELDDVDRREDLR